jgi:hypothetical protein
MASDFTGTRFQTLVIQSPCTVSSRSGFSPDFHDLTYLPLLLMLLALVAGLAASRRCPRLRNLLLVVAMIPAALRSMRHIPFLVLVIVPVLSEMTQTWLRERGALRGSSPAAFGLAPRTLAFNLIVCSGLRRLHPWPG